MKNLRLTQVSFSIKEQQRMSTGLKKSGEKQWGLLNFQNEIRKLSTVAMKVKSC